MVDHVEGSEDRRALALFVQLFELDELIFDFLHLVTFYQINPTLCNSKVAPRKAQKKTISLLTVPPGCCSMHS